MARRSLCAGIAALAASATFVQHAFAAAATYSTTGDFASGLATNVVIADDEVKLDETTTPFGFVWIAVSGRGTIAKIDARTGDVLGEYRSAPDYRGKDPSRTTVDANGNVWASNRAEYGSWNGSPRGSVVHVGLLENNQCVDRNGNGVIDTSTGLGDIRPWTNALGADDGGGVSTAADECVIHYTRVTGTGTRHLSLDADNNLWVGGIGDRDFELVDGVTGLPIPGTQFNVGCGGYGGVTDRNGVIWSTSNGTILRFDPSMGVPAGAQCLPWNFVPGAYGMAIDPNTGHVWVSELGGSNRVHEIDPLTTTILNSYPQGFGAQGLVVDQNSHVWVAELFGSRLAHFAPDLANPGHHVLVGHVGGFSGTTGVAVDRDGKIWASEYYSSSASRVDPVAGPMTASGYPLGAIERTVSLGANGYPYNYSDMTGSTIIAPPGAGSWAIVYDSGEAGAEWGRVSWNAVTPGDSAVTVVVASSEDAVAFGASEAAVSGAELSVADGRYLRVTVTLNRASTRESPILLDLAVATANEPPTVEITAPADGAVLPISPGAAVAASLADPNPDDVHSCDVDWGDGSQSAGTVAESGGAGTCDATHAYAAAGVYTVTVTVSDGEAAAADQVMIVVFDPAAGFVTGGGWIDSPPGAYAPDAGVSGPARFGFVSKYLRGAYTPTGTTEFQFRAAGMNFHSRSYEWLVVAGARAQYKGTGTIGGEEGYTFMLTAIDGAIAGGGGVDRLRMKIWNAATGELVYDNQRGASDGDAPTTAVQGSIVIHSGR